MLSTLRFLVAKAVLRDGSSCGISGTGETPQERSDEEAHRAPGTEINGQVR
ncbi:hypothetical protein [Sporosarcina ureilytica]|uniref:hypothetical protein n=1 Tax=Sporosarcina ureilytica TaxID=298596 RepID=UPI000A98645F|nr:hypothetical protein [Sporosarcina ureilytica]